MNKFFFTLCICLSFHSICTGQEGKIDTLPPPPAWEGNDTHENKLYDKVEVEASFPGGDKQWREYLEKNLDASIPVVNNAPTGKYTVIIQFVVHKDGRITDVKALTVHGYGMEKEVIRVIKNGPAWIPAIQNGRQVMAYRKQPVTFQVVEEKRKRKNKN